LVDNPPHFLGALADRNVSVDGLPEFVLVAALLPLMMSAIFGRARSVLLRQWECVERVTSPIEADQLGWALDATFPTLLRIGQVRRARQSQNSVDVLSSRLGSQSDHESRAACLHVFDYRLSHRLFFWQHDGIGQSPQALNPIAAVHGRSGLGLERAIELSKVARLRGFGRFAVGWIGIG